MDKDELKKQAQKNLVQADARMDRVWAGMRGMNPHFERVKAKLEPYKENGYGLLDKLDIQVLIMALDVISADNAVRGAKRNLDELEM